MASKTSGLGTSTPKVYPSGAEGSSGLGRLPSRVPGFLAFGEAKRAGYQLSRAALSNLEKGKAINFVRQRANILPEIDKDEDGVLTPAEVQAYRRENHFTTDDTFARHLKENGFVSALWCTTLNRMSHRISKGSDLNKGVAVISFEKGTNTENRRARLADLESHLSNRLKVIETLPQPKDDAALEDEMGK